MIKDALGQQLLYWAIPALLAGEVSETLQFTIDTPVAGGFLTSTLDERARVWVRVVDWLPFTDIAQNPIGLSGLNSFFPGESDMEMYVEALEDIEGIERVPILVSAGQARPAGWTV